MTVVTRFAPSPTGFLHIGGARTALFNWLYARHYGGHFFLRIEDTDKIRSTSEAVEGIFSSLRWLEITWDGDIRFQSSFAVRHTMVAQRLLACGAAYYCYCTPEELTDMRLRSRRNDSSNRNRLVSSGYDGRCRDRSSQNVPPDVKPTVRFRMPREGETVLNDLVQGRVTVANSQLDDMIILRADGTPTYMLSVVVDDHDMGITHVIRGDDHLTNTFRQIQIYLAMEWNIPQFAHIPLIHGQDGSKLSKRHGAVNTEVYRDKGFLPEAMRNYLARLGWSRGNAEIFTTEQAVAWFDLKKVGRNPARFDVTRLTTLNAHYLRETDDTRLMILILPRLAAYLKKPLDNDLCRERLIAAIPSLKTRVRTITELAESAIFYVQTRPLRLDDKASQQVNLLDRSILLEVIRCLSAEEVVWDTKLLEDRMRNLASENCILFSQVAQPLRAALTGRVVSPPIFEVMQILGREETVGRLNDALYQGKGSDGNNPS